MVVKVLHHGIEDSVGSDLAALKSILLTGRVLKRDRAEVDEIFDEIRERLEEELDYYQEAANLEYFHAAMAGVEGISIPRTHPEYCTDRVLTMDRLTGMPLDDFVKRASPEARQRAGDLLMASFHDMFYRLRTLHADPHAGNYLFRADGSIGILDFGCVKRFELYWVASYARMARALVGGDRPTFFAGVRELGVLTAGSAESEEVLWELGRTICRPLIAPWYVCGTDEDDVLIQVRRRVTGVLRYPNLRSPRQIIFLHRTLGGIYSMLRKLGHASNYGAVFDKHTAYAIAVAEGRIADGAPVG